MLNANARSFVPQAAGDHGAPHRSNFYRYLLMLPTIRKYDATKESEETSGLFQLLTKRLLCSYSHGGPGDDALQVFTTTFFSNVKNAGYCSGTEAPTGILLSRSILSLTGTVSDICAISAAPGFLVRVEVPKECGAEVAPQLKAAWDDYFWTLREDPRVLAVGYVGSFCGTSSSRRYAGTHRHYFFVSIIIPQPEDVHFFQTALLGINFHPLRITEVNAVASFACSMQVPLTVVVSIGDDASKKLLSDGKPDRSFFVSLYPCDVSRTLSSLKEYETHFLSLLKEQNDWPKPTVVHVNINIDYSHHVGTLVCPVFDMLAFVGDLCDDTAASVSGVCVSDTTLRKEFGVTLCTEADGWFLNATLNYVLAAGRSFDMSSTCFGYVPQHFRRSITFAQYEYAHKIAEKWLPVNCVPVPLNRMTFAAAAEEFSKYPYYVRSKTVGANVLLITNSEGDVFCVDVKTGSISALPDYFRGLGGRAKNSVFSAVVASSYRSYLDYVIIVEDILSFEEADVRELPFPERWFYVEKCLLDNYASRPHTSPNRVAIVRTIYTVSTQAERLLRNPPAGHPTLGLVFVPHVTNCKEKDTSVYSWIPTSSTTAVFIVGDVENVHPESGDVKRAWLLVADSGKNTMSYNNEYVDYIWDSAPELRSGSVIECVLKRSDDGSHWWELLRGRGPDMGYQPDTFDIVERLVHVPGLTHKEMLWLLDAAKYRCGRCHNVSDVGRMNVKHMAYWCKKCWSETGHGDCLYCGRFCVMGKNDTLNQHFYCDNCWGTFSATNLKAEIGYLAPPPENASFATHVLTRCASLLIDIITPKVATNDVLEICCGGYLLRKWIRNKTARYIGFDLKSSVVDAASELISSLRHEMTEMSFYDVICADVFSANFWSHHLTKIHPRQFHVITAFAGFHHAFGTEYTAMRLIESVANALIPGGVFIGCFFDVEPLFAKGSFGNGVFAIEWAADFLPRVGNHFLLSVQKGHFKKVNVVPVDFLVAVGRECGLVVVPKACSTFQGILDNDRGFNKTISSGEKDYLLAMRAIAFRKEGNAQAGIVPTQNVDLNRD
ncbi:hypothetical protein, conserved [Trypanosoma brucei brucei TREU927]|uniref:mRNA (guanine-N(7))-methyltransferase n=1 Tax=Trypanosoma brucei brucei (strain 927/4 GUTat10.1) TaxID=185431 RepID=Q384Z7_TRYB2|nr:hypothetical protein, conserved [Trypanosoma brucei brucei TREU927]EAN79634.1 hypothetical protein, conserved [Trypanosoma brucei brucei TREU927]